MNQLPHKEIALFLENALLAHGADVERVVSRAVLGCMADGVMTLDWEKRITSFNRAAETITGSTLLSPPPSPRTPQQSAILEQKARNVKHARMLLDLRKALGSRVFEDVGLDKTVDQNDMTLEDARDQAVDLIVDAERSGRVVLPVFRL